MTAVPSVRELTSYMAIRSAVLTADPGAGSANVYTCSLSHDRAAGRCGFTKSHLCYQVELDILLAGGVQEGCRRYCRLEPHFRPFQQGMLSKDKSPFSHPLPLSQPN